MRRHLFSLGFIAVWLSSCGASGASPRPPESAPAPVERQGNGEFWALTDDGQGLRAFEAAETKAQADGKPVLLVFVAPWCPDSRRVVGLLALPSVARARTAAFNTLSLNVEHFERHEALRKRFEVTRLATLVVVDGSGTVKAKSELEPVSKGPDVTAEQLKAWLEAAGR